MDMIEQISMWRQLYWEGIEEGLERGEAEHFANRILSDQLQRPVHLTRATPI
jgi:hypothetical protein